VAHSTDPNHWHETRCAKAFWAQHDLPCFQRLVADTVAWAAPRAGEHWLDLGCGGGALTRALWDHSGGHVREVVGVDCAAVNAERYARLSQQMGLEPDGRLRFVCHDFSRGLGLFGDRSFDHAISGLSITYAEDWDENGKHWTRAAYDRVLAEVARVLRPGGRFVFSVNVPEPSWALVTLHSLTAVFTAGRPLQFLKRSWYLCGYGAWLKQEARCGRFHYLPHAEVAEHLAHAGFQEIEHRLSYADQAYIFRARKPA
jgi:ubiquinone/menaquinone biosynthesis C-methylase UbiE